MACCSAFRTTPAGSSFGAAARLGPTCAGWPLSDYGCEDSSRSARQVRVAVQSVVDEAHDARQYVDPSVGGARLADRALGYESAALQFLLHLVRNQTQRSDEPRRGDRYERRRL